MLSKVKTRATSILLAVLGDTHPDSARILAHPSGRAMLELTAAGAPLARLVLDRDSLTELQAGLDKLATWMDARALRLMEEEVGSTT